MRQAPLRPGGPEFHARAEPEALMDNEIRLLFVSDIHLGMKNDETGIPDYARANTFKRIAAIGREHDILLIGGDLIDSPGVGEDVIDLIRDEFRGLRNAGTEIFYVPGAGETGGLDSLPPVILDFNVSCLFAGETSSAPHLFMKDGRKLYVYGVPVTAGCDISRVSKISEEGYHIGLLHVDFNFDEDPRNSLVYRLQKNEMRSLGLDFYAFGFSHGFRMFKIMDRIIGVCPGSPEATSFDENGDRYAVSIVIKDDRLYQLKRLTVNSMRLHRDRVDCSGLVTMGPIKELLENNKSKKAIQLLVLQGERDFVLRRDELSGYEGDFFRLKIEDQSIPTLDALIEEFQYENSLRGEFFKIVKERIDRGEVPHEIDGRDLAVSLDRITREGFAGLEEWLCAL